MRVVQTSTFAKAYKKLHKNQLADVNQAIEELIKNPFIGEKKKQDLSHVYVYKFKMVKQLTLLAYMYEEEQIILTLLALDSHQNFYDKLKKA